MTESVNNDSKSGSSFCQFIDWAKDKLEVRQSQARCQQRCNQLFKNQLTDPKHPNDIILHKKVSLGSGTSNQAFSAWKISKDTGEVSSNTLAVILAKDGCSPKIGLLQRLREVLGKTDPSYIGQAGLQGLEIPETLYNPKGTPVRCSSRYQSDLALHKRKIFKEKAPPLTDLEKALIAADIIQGLRTLHRLGIVHRDIKKENIVVDLNGEQTKAALIDFESCGALKDSPEYFGYTFLSPELFEKHFNFQKYYKKKSLAFDWQLALSDKEQLSLDIFTLGVVLYDLYNLRQTHPSVFYDNLMTEQLRWQKDHTFFKTPTDKSSLEYLIWEMCGPEKNRPTIDEVVERFQKFLPEANGKQLRSLPKLPPVDEKQFLNLERGNFLLNKVHQAQENLKNL